MYRNRIVIINKCQAIQGPSKVLLSSVGGTNIKENVPKTKYNVVVIGAGHNGLVSAAYLQKAGAKVCVLERRHVIGGAAVTEEIVPGFQFSRASYLLSLLRPQIYKDLELKKHGLKVYFRSPSSYTPLRTSYWKENSPRSLILGKDKDYNMRQISQFSKKDAEIYESYEHMLEKVINAVDPLLDIGPSEVDQFLNSTLSQKLKHLYLSKQLRKSAISTINAGKDITYLYELLTSPANKILSRWFESEPLKATLATDSVIGVMAGPDTPGTGYVLLHHVAGSIDGVLGAWGYPEGGMGAVSKAIASAALTYGTEIFTNKTVTQITCDTNGKATGVVTSDGQEIQADIVLSNATAKVTFLDLLPSNSVSEEFKDAVRRIDYSSPVVKINVAVSKIPNFIANPCTKEGETEPHHQCSIHMNCEETSLISQAYQDAVNGIMPNRPMIEMVIPSSLDKTISPKGCHVCLLFTQYAPQSMEWNTDTKADYADKVFRSIEEYAPGFKSSIVGYELLAPPDLQEIFGLTGGNIFHGAITPEQLFLCRPVPSGIGPRSPFTPVTGLFLCGSGAHPGGGVMGAPGYIAAQSAKSCLIKSHKLNK